MSGAAGSVIVAGGGIVGIACSHYLREAGFEVTVIDQGAIGGECSHGNCGYICPSHVAPLTEPGAMKVALKSLFNPQSPFRVKPRFSPALARWMLQFAARCTHRQVLSAGKHLQAILNASMAEYRSLVAAEQLDCEWEDKGLLYVFENQGPLEAFAAEDRLLGEHFGLWATRLSSAELTDFDPGLKPGLAGGFHYPGANAADLDEDEQVKIFSTILVKNLVSQECAAAEQEEKQEEMEIKAEATAVLHQIIREECNKLDAEPEPEKVRDGPNTGSEAVPTSNTIDVEDKAEIVAPKEVDNVTEAKVSGTDAIAQNEEPCPKCKGSGKTNMMGGTRGFSFMKSQCKQCSSRTKQLAAKAGA